jgi:hypothetical protein
MDNDLPAEIVASLQDYYDLDDGRFEKAIKMPEVITVRSLIQEVAVRWNLQYERYYDSQKDKKEIFDRLDLLDKKIASESDVSEIIGNNYWTRICCDQCKRSVHEAVMVGSPPGYESSTAVICAKCLDIAQKRLKESTQ